MNTRLATFWAGGLLLGVDVNVVQEVLVAPDVTPVPLAPQSVVGVLNLRGQLLTAIDARQRLGLPGRAPGEEAVHFIIRTPDEMVSLVVDAVGDVVDVDTAAFEAVPELVGECVRALTTATCQVDAALLMVLDAERTVSVTAGER